jgi:hypothetical protein
MRGARQDGALGCDQVCDTVRRPVETPRQIGDFVVSFYLNARRQFSGSKRLDTSL